MKFLIFSNRHWPLLLLLFLGPTLGIGLGMTLLAAPSAADEQTYTNPAAAYSLELPPDTQVSESADAALPYPLVFFRLPVVSTPLYQGVSVLVIDTPTTPAEYVAQAYQDAGLDPQSAPRVAGPTPINGRAALRLERDNVVGDGDKFTTLIAGDGVIYRVNLFGGGKGGPSEPAAQATAQYERLVRSFRVLAVERQPKPVAQAAPAPAAVAVADRFDWPLRSGQGVNYGVPIGRIVADTRMEWLGYGIRNLDQWGVKCYGVDWSRMIHTGEDWYRLDGALTAGAPVYAVANGVVVKHNPGISYPGNVVMIRHRLPDGRDIYSMYGHVNNVRVVEGQTVTIGQQIATVIFQNYTGRTPNEHPGYDAHMHFEMRWFLDGTNIYVPGTNAYNYNYPSCTYAYPGRGYTYIIHPDQYPYPDRGWVEPSDFIKARLGGPVTPTPTFTPSPTPTTGPQSCEYVRNGGFEDGVPTTSWVAANSQNKKDPLIYTNLPRTGRWSAWFGNVLNYTDTLRQTVTLPANRTGATLRFWRYVRSNEAASSGKDLLEIVLVKADGSEQVVRTITSAATRNQWAQETVTLDLSTPRDPTVDLVLRGRNDAAAVSSFFVDDMSLTMPCGPGGQALVRPAGTPEAPAAQAALACTNLARDGGFESGRLGVGWAAISNTSSKLYADPAIYTRRPRTGSYGAWLGANNLNLVWNELVQTVQLPANVTSVQVRYWRYLETAETNRTQVLDHFRVGLETEKGIQIMTPQQIDNTSAGRSTWVQQTLDLPNAGNYAGRKLWLSFKATTNGSLPSSLYVDDVELLVCTTP